jgi:hypothetical protein
MIQVVLRFRGVMLASAAAFSLSASWGISQDGATADKFYRVVDGKVDARTFNGSDAIIRVVIIVMARMAWVQHSALP